RLEAADDRVALRLPVLGRVPLRGRVAAPDPAAGQAQPQVDPRRAVAQAVLAPVGGVRPYGDGCLAQVVAEVRVVGPRGQLAVDVAGLVLEAVEQRLLEVERAEH